MDKQTILAMTTPKQLFGNNDRLVEMRRLAGIWHPDRGGDAQVFAHIRKLYEKGKEEIANSRYHVEATDGRKFHGIRVKLEDFELGKVTIGRDFLAYESTQDNDDLLRNFRRVVQHDLTFCNQKVMEYFSKTLPRIRDVFPLAQGGCVLLLDKAPELVRLKDLKEHMGEVPVRHVAWIITRLLNLCIYLQRHNLTHNGIATETVFVSPKEHTAHLLGGWFYSVPPGHKMLAAPNKTIAYAPASLLQAKKGDIRTDLEMAKATARELLGDVSGSTLYKNSSIPKPMLDWLRQPCGGDAMEEYSRWYDVVLDQSFGKKQFIELKVSFDDVY